MTFNEKEYKKYLESLIDSVFKILPLYEDKNEFLEQYIQSVIDYDVLGGYELIQEYEYYEWYNSTITTLNGLKKALKSSKGELSHSQVKSEVFKITNLISMHKKGLC